MQPFGGKGDTSCVANKRHPGNGANFTEGEVARTLKTATT